MEAIEPDDILEEVPAPLQAQRPDLINAMREMIGELELLATSWQAAGLCAAALMRTLRARAVIIHSYDPRTRELRVIGADGAGTRGLLGGTEPADDDFVASTVLANGKPMTLRFEGELPRFAPERLGQVGAAHSFLAVPAMTSTGCVAIIEVVDVDDALADRALEACGVATGALVRFHSKRAVAA